MVSVCLPCDALLQHQSSYLGFSYLGRGVSLHGCSSKAQPPLLTLDEGYLLTATPPDLQRGIAPLGPLAPVQPWLLGHGVGPPGHRPWPRSCGRDLYIIGKHFRTSHLLYPQPIRSLGSSINFEYINCSRCKLWMLLFLGLRLTDSSQN